MNRADRKKQLIAQGALYRAEVMLAKQATQEAAQPQALIGNTLPHLAFAALALFRKRNGNGLPGAFLPAVLPLVTGAVSALAKRKPSLKAILRSALIAGAAAGVVALVAKRKKPAQHTAPGSTDGTA